MTTDLLMSFPPQGDKGTRRSGHSHEGSDRGLSLTLAAACYRFYCEHREYDQIMAMLYLCQKDFFKNCMMVSALEHNTIVILMVIEAFVNEEMQASENMPIDSWRATICLWGMIDGSSSSRRGKITAACISPSMISKDRWL
jgi:hypothetical protein